MKHTYMTKPVTVEAFKMDLLEGSNTISVPRWIIAALTGKTIYTSMDGTITYCKTRQGPVKVNDGDWLIKLDDGEIYPCADEVFKNKYEEVPEVTK